MSGMLINNRVKAKCLDIVGNEYYRYGCITGNFMTDIYKVKLDDDNKEYYFHANDLDKFSD